MFEIFLDSYIGYFALICSKERMTMLRHLLMGYLARYRGLELVEYRLIIFALARFSHAKGYC